MAAARLFSIPPGAPFLDTLVAALLDGRLVPGFDRGVGPLQLADATIYVPTRRAARALTAALAAQLGGGATFLPRILPLGAADALEAGLILDAAALPDPLDGPLPPAIDPIERRMILTRLILAWSASVKGALLSVDRDRSRTTHDHEALLVGTTPADAWHLSGELATLLDELATEEVSWEAVAPLGTEAFDRYWSITLDFLSIAVTRWPAILAQLGRIDPAARNARLIEAEIARLATVGDAGGPVIVAGSTGSQRPTARLIAAVARLPRGAVVLPGLDQRLDDTSWAAIGAAEAAASTGSHPQAALHRLLATMGVDRSAVTPLGVVPEPLAAREWLVSEALRPAETTDAWHRLASEATGFDSAAALDGVSLIEAADEREEALGLAVALRETLEGSGDAILVTPDRTLAHRVREEMLRWNIEIDDSGGEALGQTGAGALARLVLDCVTGDLAPLAALALLAHPAVRLGRSRSRITALSRMAEIVLLRGVLPRRALHDFGGLIETARQRAATPDAPRALRAMQPDDFTAIEALFADLARALAPLLGGDRDRETPLPDWLDAHNAVVAALVLTESGGSALGGVDGTALAGLFDTFRQNADPAITLGAAGYAALFERFAAETVVRGPARSHPRLKILGLLEARLLQADRILIAGLDEGLWPPQVRADAFLNRPMRAALGLSAPERRIGQTAHDFSMALGHREVVISRAAKRGGSPTVPSRLLQRLRAVSGEAWDRCVARGATYKAWALSLDAPTRAVLIGPPLPRPPLHLRPTRLSVTRVEMLRRDPYAIYADRILKLRPLDALGADYGPREWGTLFHDVLSAFAIEVGHHPLAADALDALMARMQRQFAPLLAEPSFRAFMGARLDTWARAYHRWESTRRSDLAALHVEAVGELAMPLSDGSTFTLTAHADRIETVRAGVLHVIDYKTGAAPSKKEVQVGFSPQLTLEAAMAARGAFATIGASALVESAHYVKFGSSAEVDVTTLSWTDRAFADVVQEHFDGLVALLESFRDPAMAYVSRPYPQFLARHSDYDHLARVKEWSATGRGGEDDA